MAQYGTVWYSRCHLGILVKSDVHMLSHVFRLFLMAVMDVHFPWDHRFGPAKGARSSSESVVTGVFQVTVSEVRGGTLKCMACNPKDNP